MQEMNEQIRENTIAKISKLLALANDDGATPAESELAMKRATQIMGKYKIEMAEVQSKRKSTKSVDEMTDREDADCYFYSKGYSNWEFNLAWGISPIFDVECVQTWGEWKYNPKKRKNDCDPKMAFMGVPEDVALVLYFFDYCQNEIGRACEVYDKRVTVQQTFAIGMVGRICHRLRELYKRVRENLPSDCMDIVLYNKDLAKNRKDLEFPLTKIHKGPRTKYNEHYFNGIKAGKHLHLSSNRDQVH